MSILSRAGRRVAVAGIGMAVAVTTLGTGAAQAGGIRGHLPTVPISIHPTAGSFAPTADPADVRLHDLILIDCRRPLVGRDRDAGDHRAADGVRALDGSEGRAPELGHP